MIRHDLDILLKGTLAVSATVATLQLTCPLPIENSLSVITGQIVLAFVFVVYLLSINSLLTTKWCSRLLPQTQWVLWFIGIGAILTGTQGWRHFEPSVGFWIIMAFLLTFFYRDAWRWLIRSQRTSPKN